MAANLAERCKTNHAVAPDRRLAGFRAELKRFHDREFAGTDHFTVVYGSYAFGTNNRSSDVDMVTVCREIDPARLRKTIDFVFDFHKEHGLEIDNEVPYENKLLATFAQAEDALAGRGFDLLDYRVVVPPVVKTKGFLESEEVALRLLLNALTGGSVLISGDAKKHETLVLRARENLVALMFSIENRGFFSVGSFVQSLIGNDKKNGESYLGYKDNPVIRGYLTRVFGATFERLVKTGRLERIGGSQYVVKDHAWLASVAAGRRRDPDAERDLSANLNPYGPPKSIERLASDAVSLLSVYPEMHVKEPLKGLSGFFKVPERNIRVLNGSTDFFLTAPESLGFDRGIVVSPTFWEYSLGFERKNKEVLRFRTDPADDFTIDIGKLGDMIAEHRNNGRLAVYLCNPNNPTGTFHSSEELLGLAGIFPTVTFVVDETHLLFDKDYENATLSSRVPENGNLVVVYSVSKFFAVPGARLGCVIASEENIGRLERTGIPYNVNTIASELIGALFSDTEFIARSRDGIFVERGLLRLRLKEIPQLTVHGSRANFLLCRIRSGDATSDEIHGYLKKRGLVVRNCDGYAGLDNRYFRVAIGTGEDMRLLVSCLKEFFTKKDQNAI
jgi:threonine-phosphate decarboxylase